MKVNVSLRAVNRSESRQGGAILVPTAIRSNDALGGWQEVAYIALDRGTTCGRLSFSRHAGKRMGRPRRTHQ